MSPKLVTRISKDGRFAQENRTHTTFLFVSLQANKYQKIQKPLPWNKLRPFLSKSWVNQNYLKQIWLSNFLGHLNPLSQAMQKKLMKQSQKRDTESHRERQMHRQTDRQKDR